MRRPMLLVTVIYSLLTVNPQAQGIQVREETLQNGMRILMLERHASPTIACGWIARVGSVNERPGITGISHLFEHMMFKGTKTIGVKDYEKALEVQKAQDAIRAQMEQEYTSLRELLRKGEISGNIYDPENMTPRLKELRSRLEELFKEEKKYLVSNEIDEIYTREGALAMNAGTFYDWTFYYLGSLPANKLELWFWLESDRLLNPVFREFYSERDVVREERRRSVESTPTGKLDELFNSMFWESVPYSWPVIGWPSDVESITRTQAEDYFDTYYAPNNITAVLVGDFNSDEVLQLADRYFGRIPKGSKPAPEMITTEMPQVAEKRLSGQADTNPTVRIRFHVPAFNHRDTFPLQILADALDGRTGRLFKALVEEKDLAVGEPYAQLMDLKFAGYFEVGAEVKEGRDPADVETALLGELEKVRQKPLEELELQKVKNQEMADSFRRLLSNFFLLQQLLIYDANDHWSYINTMPAKLQAVSVTDVQEVAEKYLAETNRNVAVYLRKTGSKPEPSELRDLPPQVKAMVTQQLAEIAEISDPARLEQGMQQMIQMRGQAPPEMGPAIDYLIEKMKERIEELSKDSATSETDGSGAQ